VQRLSTYAEDLPNGTKARCREKLEVIGGNDPFLSGELVDHLPDVESSDVVLYLVLQISFIFWQSNLKLIRALKLITNLSVDGLRMCAATMFVEST